MGNHRAHLKKLWRRLLFLLDDESGQGTVEYILILSVSVVGAGAVSRSIMEALDKGLLRFGAQLEKDLKTGRAPLNIWEN